MKTSQILSLILAGAFLAGAAEAKDKGHGNGHGGGKHASGKSEKYEDHDWDDRDDRDHGDDDRRDRVPVFYGADLGRARVDLQPYYQQHCPPGLAKKHNGCLPPGQAKKLYTVGQPLPTGVVYWPVPQPVLATLPPPPPYGQYVMVDRNLLLISEGTKKVLDAVVLFSGVQ